MEGFPKRERNEIVDFYKLPFESFSFESVLKTLARTLTVSKQKNLMMHYTIAKNLFDKTTSMMEMQYKEIAVSTIAATELKLYQDLNDEYHSGKFIQLTVDQLLSATQTWKS